MSLRAAGAGSVALFAVVVGFLLLPTEADAGSGSTTSHWDEGSTVTFDLERGRITETLPFDVPFYLLAKVDDGARKVCAKQGKPKNQVANVEGEAKKVCATQGGPSDPGCLDPVALPAKIVKIAKAGADPSVKETFIEVAVGPLDPRASYCFSFTVDRKRNDAEKQKIVAAFTSMLDKSYGEMSAESLSTTANDLAFRTKLRAAIEEAVAPAKVSIINGSALDTSIKHQPLATRMTLGDPLEKRTQADTFIKTYSARVPDKALTLAAGSSLELVKETLRRALTQAQAAGKDETELWNAAIEELAAASGLLQVRQQRLEFAAAELEAALADTYDVSGSTTAPYEARFGWYVSADLGLAAVPETDEVSAYIGANLYFRPVNKKAPMTKFSQRFALMAGLTVDKLSDSTRTGILSDRPVLLGAGYRLTEHIRVGVGAELFKEDDPDPLVTDKALAVTPFVSFSIDWDVAQQFKDIFSALKP